MENFNGQDLISFVERFKTDLDCKKYLSENKWKDGYQCVKCGYDRCQIRPNYSRTCNKCSHTESASANTLFHKLKFGLRKSFLIIFEMSTSTKSLSAMYVSKRYTIHRRTARLFMQKVREGMKSSLSAPMEGEVEVDEFVIGGREVGKVGRSYSTKKKKVAVALELTDKKRVKRMYAIGIDDFSHKSLRLLFDKHISVTASVRTDKWRGYRPLKQKYNITQELSDNGKNFQILHIMIHKVKSWIRTIYSHVSHKYLQRYLDDFCYRLNRSQSKATIFHNLISRMVKSDKLYYKEIIGA